MTHRQEFRIGMIRPDVSRLHPVVTLKTGKKIGQKLAIFWSNFCPQTTTSCGQTLLFLLFSTILHHYYTLHMP